MIWLRRTHPEIPRGYRVPLYPVAAGRSASSSCFALIFTVETRVLIFFGWYMLGAIVLYFVYGMHFSKLGKGEPRLAGPDLPEFPEDAPPDADGKPVIRP